MELDWCLRDYWWVQAPNEVMGKAMEIAKKITVRVAVFREDPEKNGDSPLVHANFPLKAV